jgi:hypothetical protein
MFADATENTANGFSTMIRMLLFRCDNKDGLGATLGFGQLLQLLDAMV